MSRAVEKNLTGKTQWRRDFLGKIVLQVQFYAEVHREMTPGDPYPPEPYPQWGWRDAVAEDMQRLVFPKRFEKVEE